MTYAPPPEVAHHTSDTTWHVITAVLAVFGVVAAAVGAWLEFGPEAGTLSLFDWTWEISELPDPVAPLLMVGGGFLAAMVMGIESTRDWELERNRWLVSLELLVTLAGIAAVVVGMILLFA